MKYLKWFICIIILLGYTPAIVGAFEFADKDVTVQFKYGFTAIPQATYSGNRLYADSGKPDTADAVSLKNQKDMSENNSGTDQDLDKLRNDLDIKKKELLDEYQAIMDEREALESLRQSTHRKYAPILNQKITDINEKIENYEAKLAAYNEEVEQYNLKILENNKGKSKDAKSTP